ncbi:MAG TPA: phosphoribosylglycinamide formyltransferase [Syntrophales bacterium]|nr:phosphoribosylglycinamide formyltransferase [Syntrophales bacterium]
MREKVKLGILASGSGSNLQAIIDNIENGRLDGEIKVVICNNDDAYALIRAKKHNIPSVVIRHSEFKNREDFDRKMVDVLKSFSVELVVMAGFMRLLTPLFLNTFPLRVMNIHPAILPAFPGTHAQKRAADYGVRFSGCTVHFADEGVDSGPIIIQAVVPVYDDDTEDTLGARILKEEHRIFSQAIQFYAERRIEIIGRKVIIKDSAQIPETPLHNPPVTAF